MQNNADILDVLCIGQMAADVVVRPVPSFDFRIDSTLVDSIELTNGGDAFNTAVNLAVLGINTGLIGRVGNDHLGHMLLATAKRYGIDGGGIAVSEHDKTSSCLALINAQGERRFIYFPGTNKSLSCKDIDSAYVRKARIVHLGGVFNIPLIEQTCLSDVLKNARRAGATTSMDVTWDNEGRWLPKIRDALPYLDYFLPSLNEVKSMLKTTDPRDAAMQLLDLGVKNVVIKLGAQGCYVANSRESKLIKGFSVHEVIDTTGAGDAFVAGFLTGVSRDWPFFKSAQLGNAVGALAVQKMGATAGATDFETAYTLMSGEKGEL